MFGLVQSFGDLGATLVAGLIWALVSPTAAFSFAAVWMLASLLLTSLTGGNPSTTREPPL